MRTIYLNSDYKCHLSDDGTMKAVETDAFDGKCNSFIEGYRFIPFGEEWARHDGVVFTGEMISPWRDYELLCEFQTQYEAMIVEQQDMKTALNELGVKADG